MKCPQCRQSMETKHFDGIAVDECPRCRGIWFDPGEIDELVDDLEPDLRWAEFEMWKNRADFRAEFDRLDCPRCINAALAKLCDTDSDTCIRLCPQCRGSWMTPEDFAAIVHSLSAELERRTASDYFKLSLKQAGEVVTAGGGMISEWKDLKALMRLLKYRVFVENPKLETVMKGLQKTLPL